MPRTTLDIDQTVLQELKRRREREGKSIGQLASELMAGALSAESSPAAGDAPLEWTSSRMRARMDLEDKDALEAALSG